ncbi:MAG: peptide chain release factor N(5)-glutamine methyltransferase [Salinivirgaceae bacterium]|nr:peptide chain release factor N(5)-glutamine methyltransferase [Salinivirgaceae bacterium]MDD4746912.1 peptide chain release factor N(5)-glutamine methyltransferase [Salinivirgaceae bacterium]MDY0279491.1 peptide chain release factor N(5)-glutamine methyltransferase [Salinivirgaceae bacterium]
MSITTYRQLQQLFVESLAQIYEQSEIKAIFFRLIEDLYHIPKYKIVLDFDLQMSSEMGGQLLEFLKQLEKAVPLQYVTNKAFFYGREFFVKSGVLIPRPETEELVQHCLTFVKSGWCVLDIGTGSGCIAITLAKECANILVTAFDISPVAVEVATMNCDTHKADIQILEHNIFELPVSFYDQKFDLIVSNPPYVTDAEKRLMHKNVTDHEPHLALFVPNDDSLQFYEAIALESVSLLSSQGVVFVEINEVLGYETKLVFEQYFNEVIVINDFRDKPRFVKACGLKKSHIATNDITNIRHGK